MISKQALFSIIPKNICLTTFFVKIKHQRGKYIVKEIFKKNILQYLFKTKPS